MDDLNQVPALAMIPPRVRVFQSVLAIAVFSLVPLWPANAQAASPAVAQAVASVGR
jgi:hypothetical protein